MSDPDAAEPAVEQVKEEEEAWEPSHDYVVDEEDFACDLCFHQFEVGETRWHSSIDNEFDCCEKCRTEELDLSHHFVPIVIEKVNGMQILNV